MTHRPNFRAPAPQADVADAPRAWWRHVVAVGRLYGMTDIRVEAAKATPTTPEEWVAAAMAITCTCPKCGGSGVFKSAKSSGTCFGCHGYGTVDHKNRKRNLDYWDRNTWIEACIVRDSGAHGLRVRNPSI